MSHRVIQADSKVSSAAEAENLQTEILNKIGNQNYDLHRKEVNDGENLEGEYTLAITTDHNNNTEANKFYDLLWSWAQNNKAEYDNEDNIKKEGFKYFRLQIHDCKHLDGFDEPCKIGNADKFEVV